MGKQLATWLVLALLGLSACKGKEHDAKDPNPNERKEALKAKYQEKLELAKDWAKKDYGNWLVIKDCDAALWMGKYSCADKIPEVDLTVAEYPDQPGRFDRRPPPGSCWNPEAGDIGSKTTWSRDMGKGLYRWAWCGKHLDALERHAKYGNSKNWKMGEPLADGRVLYTPAMIGELYELIHALGGEDNPGRIWPTAYPKGLDDYEAHLQVLSIQIRGEIAEGFGNLALGPKKPDGADGSGSEQENAKEGTALLDVSETMYDRLREHAKREPKCAYYQYMLGVYDGSMDKALELLLNDSSECQYVRKDASKEIRLAEWLAVASSVIRRLNKVQID